MAKPAISGQILELSFVNDHKQLFDGIGCGVVGKPLNAPHWTNGGVNSPVTYTRGTTISVNVTVSVRPEGAKYKLFGIDKKQMFFNFESPTAVATGLPQAFTLKAKGRAADGRRDQVEHDLERGDGL